jgi:hypothetical protein
VEIKVLKEQIINSINSIEDKIFLEELESALQQTLKAKGDFWNDLPRIVKDKIDTAQGEIANGQFISEETISKEINSRFGI